MAHATFTSDRPARAQQIAQQIVDQPGAIVHPGSYHLLTPAQVEEQKKRLAELGADAPAILPQRWTPEDLERFRRLGAFNGHPAANPNPGG